MNRTMKTERQIAEQIFQLFRNINCKENQGFMMNMLNLQVVYKLNPKEQEIFNNIYDGLQALQYISVDNDGKFIRLTKKGYDYIYDDNLVDKMQSIPWVIPKYKDSNWVAAWNKLWKIIDSQPFYQSGPMFMKYICELDETIENDYSRYIEFRRNKGLSTSRKDYFRDLLDGLTEEKRYEFYVRIQESFEDTIFTTINITDNKFEPFIDLELASSVSQQSKENEIAENNNESHPKVFISYSWDSEEHKKWVLDFATKLCKNGIDVILDQWEISSKGGSPIPTFMLNSVSSSERVLCIMTPNYKLKTDKLDGGVGFEYSILSSELADDLQSTKFIPILRKGEAKESTPILLNQRIAYYMRDKDDFEVAFTDLLRDLYNEPKNVKPALGKKPKFD